MPVVAATASAIPKASAAPAVSNSTAGFGALKLERTIEDGMTSSAGALYAKIYENGITVSRQGLSISRKSTFKLAQHWVHNTGFPAKDYVEEEHRLTQKFATGNLNWYKNPPSLQRIARLGTGNVETSPFKDVPRDHELFWGVYAGHRLGLLNGWDDGTFRPNDPVLRDAFAAFCYRAAGSPAFTPPTKSPFKDVATSNIFYKEIAWMHSAGISKGWPDGTYRPLEPILRDAVAAMIMRLTDPNRYSFSAESTPWFVDVPTSNIFYKEIAWMKAAGITNGWVVDENAQIKDWAYEFRPFSTTTRAEAASFLSRWELLFGDIDERLYG